MQRRSALSTNKFDFKLKLIYQNTNEKIMSKTKSNKLVTKMLVIISVSYALLNLPYLITWSLFYKGKFIEFKSIKSLVNNFITYLIYKSDIIKETTTNDEASVQNYLFAAVQICQMFYLLNYGLHFYFYCLSGSMFCNQLKYLSKFR